MSSQQASLLAAVFGACDCVRPSDCFRRVDESGGFILWGILVAYAFKSLGSVCEDYFVPCLNALVGRLRISEDLAEATLLAAGTTAPELFTSFVATFMIASAGGVGTVIGSATFNILSVVGVSGFVACRKRTMRIWWYPLVRDGFWYLLSLVWLLVIVLDEQIVYWEALVLFIIYILYCLNMRINAWIMRKLHIIDPHKPVIEDDDEGIEEISFGNQVIKVRAVEDKDLEAGSLGEDPLDTSHDRSGSKNSIHSSHHSSHGGSRTDSKNIRSREAPSALEDGYGEQSDYANMHRSGHGGHGFDDHREDLNLQAEPHSFGRSLGEGSDLHSGPSRKHGAHNSDLHGGSTRRSIHGGGGLHGGRQSLSPHGGRHSLSPHGGRHSLSPHAGRHSLSPPRNKLAIGDGSHSHGGAAEHDSSGFSDHHAHGGAKHDFSPAGRSSSKNSTGPNSRGDHHHHHGDLRSAGVDANPAPTAPGTAATETSEHPPVSHDLNPVKENAELVQPASGPTTSKSKASVPAELKPFHRRDRPDETEEHDGFAYFARDPLVTLLDACMPDPTRGLRQMLVVFLLSLFFIFLLSYLMMDSADRLGCVLKIPRFTMGLVVLAAGTSVPHALRAHTVAKEGESAELVAHVLSHNIFIVSAGLGLPWLLRSAADNGDALLFPGERNELIEGIVFALVAFLLFIGYMALNKFRLSKKIGKMLISIYCLYLFYIFLMLVAGVKVDNDNL